MSYEADEELVRYEATRIRLVTRAHLLSLVQRFEELVPELTDAAALARVAEDGDWAGFVRGLSWEAPSGFVRVWSSRPAELMRHAGSEAPSASYLIAHHAIGARLFRHDPGALLYSPLRIELHAVPTGGTVIGFEQPSAQLRGFGVNKITQAGSELDRALGDLLEELELPRPSVLRR